MDTNLFLAEIQNAGMIVSVSLNGNLRLEPKNRITDELRTMVRMHKAEILDELRMAKNDENSFLDGELETVRIEPIATHQEPVATVGGIPLLWADGRNGCGSCRSLTISKSRNGGKSSTLLRACEKIVSPIFANNFCV